MTDMKGNRVRRILDMKRQPPAYQQLDIEPKEGGRSLLHDEFGLPKVSATPTNKGDIPVMPELSSEPVQIKASVPDPNKVQIAHGIPKRGNPSPKAQAMVDDGFFPPKNNFVAVGQVDTAWATKEVTGLPDTDNTMVDNNWPEDSSEEDGDVVERHVASLQGANPLADLEKESISAARKQFEHRLKHISTEVIGKLQLVETLDELEDFKANVLGKGGVMNTVLRQFAQIPPADRRIVGELINSVIDQLKIEFEAKENELIKYADDEEEDEPTEEDWEEYSKSELTEENESNIQWEDGEEPDEEPGSDIPPATAKISSALAEGQFAILIDDKLFTTVDSSEKAKDAISRLILGNNVPVESIQLIKRIPIDFGVILGD